MPAITEKIISAATAAVLSQREALEGGGGPPNVLTLRLVLANNGDAIEWAAWTETRGCQRTPVQRHG